MGLPGLNEDQNMNESNEVGTINLEEARRMDADSVAVSVVIPITNCPLCRLAGKQPVGIDNHFTHG